MSEGIYLAVAGAVALAFLAAAITTIVRRRIHTCPRCGSRLSNPSASCQDCAEVLAPYGPAASRVCGAGSPSPMLFAEEGPLAPQRLVIPSQGLTIGRHPDNDTVLTDELMVSRFHSAIAPENGQYVLYDRDSANGTWVNDQRIFRHVLNPGDRIQIWNSKFIFSLSDTLPPPPPPSPPPPPVHTVGEQFCGYRLESVIGRGGHV